MDAVGGSIKRSDDAAIIGGQQMNEQSWILLGKKRGWFWYGWTFNETEGIPTNVENDDALIEKREEAEGDVIGFFHTHPNFTASPSSLDDKTMRSWVTSFGKPLACCIKGVDGLRAHWYVDDESEPVETKVLQVGSLLFGRYP